MKHLFKAFSIGVSLTVLLLSGCGNAPSVSSVTSSSSEAPASTFSFYSTDNGATIAYESQTIYHKGDLVRFKINLKEGFKLDKVLHNNVELTKGESEYPYSVLASSTNKIKAVLSTEYSIEGKLTFNGEMLSESQASVLGIKAKDAVTLEEKEGIITYETGVGASYKIKNILKNSTYSLSFFVYTSPGRLGPVDFFTTTVESAEGSTAKNIDVITKRDLSDSTVSFPKKSGQIYNVYNIKDGWQGDDYIAEVFFKSSLSEAEASSGSSVSTVIQFSGLSQGNSSGGDVLAVRLLYQDTSASAGPGSKFYRFQICNGDWTTIGLDTMFTVEEIEGDGVSLLASFNNDAISFYLTAGGRTEYLCVYSDITVRQNVKYIDCNAWSGSSVGEVNYTGCVIHGGVSSPGEIGK